ncbi:MAG: hypothetical protein KAX39_07655 [candidate division Zixibacteria bacterium]|nr:hypothetical protein [candidate division Zixibacteria bacterium]
MSKIVRVVNAMIEKSDKITEVTPAQGRSDEYYFLYDGKYRWSVSYDDDANTYFVHYYPNQQAIRSLAAAWEMDVPPESVAYNTADLGTREAYASFRDLYKLVQEKVHGIDGVFDDILGTTDKDDLPF